MDGRELIEISSQLAKAVDDFEMRYGQHLQRVVEAAQAVARAWSGSNLGYHSCVYYDGFRLPPPGARFSVEWGLIGEWPIEGTVGDWREYQFEEVTRVIWGRAGDPDLLPMRTASARVEQTLFDCRADVVSSLTLFLDMHGDPYIRGLMNMAEKVKLLSAHDVVRMAVARGGVMTRDTTAMGQGMRPAPHQAVLSEVLVIRQPAMAAKELAGVARQAGSHIVRGARRDRKQALVGTNVFIGHGRSLLWRELKDFVNDRLGLPYDEFNRVPVAGVTNTVRLGEMLDAASIAFLILTAEDEQADGKLSARMNVIHEVGLFQGRLGFTRAIVLLEAGCEEFSNIQGLGQIRFPKSNIGAAFEEIRRVLEREKLIPE
jgi:predicted nucleotide-binding protein